MREKKSSDTAKEVGTGKEGVITLSESEYRELKEEKVRSRERFEQILRLRAEFENFHKRVVKEKEEFARFANAELIRELLNIVDDFERATASAQAHEDHEKLCSGLKMILSRLNEMLRESGLKKMEAVGKAFDPHLHEAVLQTETNDHPEGTVVEELRAGYLLGDRVIRHATVKIAKKPDKDKSK